MSSGREEKEQKESAQERNEAFRDPKASPNQKKKKATRGDDSFHVVAIGASAGGLEALEKLFAHMPAETGVAFVVVQHLDPDHESHTPELLADKTELRVVAADQGMTLEADVVYVKSPGKMLSISGGAFQLIDPPQEKDRYLPIDLFFRDLADDQGEKAIGIILSGAGGDGSKGLRAIHRAGGAVFVQDPEQAAHNGMPRSAIETGLADFVLPVEKMPKELGAFLKHPALRSFRNTALQKELDRRLPGILRSLRSQTGQDFGQYKKSTVRRRIQRRMAIQHIESMEEYARFLSENSSEAEALFRDLLINVTSFFRDPEAFAELKKLLAERIDEADSGQELRIWCPGCATGEEAYSIAMLVCELFEEQHKEMPVRIFATDLNAPAIDYAREAVYPENIAADISKGRLQRFFHKKSGRYKIDARLREMVVFAIHNLTSTPPFSRLDLVSCRNLLIYLDSSLQKKIIPLLHYSLKPGGLLFLGKSEDVSDFTNLFAPLDKKFKIFRARQADSQSILHELDLPSSLGGTQKMENEKIKKDQRARKALSEDQGEAEKTGGHPPGRTPKTPDMRSLVERTIMERYAPPGVLVDGHNEIRYFHGDTGRYLSPPQGEPSFMIERMAVGDFQQQICEILQQARQDKERVIRREVSTGRFDDSPVVDLVATPLVSREPPHDLVLLTFEEKKKSKKPQKVDARVAALERELHSTRQDLQATIEELESSNEELQSANEELQANNEELQSANEELETSREELQSTNEELEVLNAELQEKNNALVRAKDDVNNLFNATGEGTIILDTELRIRRFTPAMNCYFNLIDSDTGRPLTDISSRLCYDDLEKDVHHVLDRLETRTREVRTRDDEWVQVKIQPYRTSDNVIAGVVLTCTDLTRLKASEQQAQGAQRFAEAILETMHEPLLVLGGDLRIVSANRAFYKVFGLSPKETIDHLIYKIDGGSLDLPELRKMLEEVIPKRNEIFDYVIESGHNLLLNARRMTVEEDAEEKILLSFQPRNVENK